MYSVYLISAEIDGIILYKIGYTRRSIDERIREFKTANASNFEIISYFNSKWGPKIERTLHRKFSYKKISGEWFRLEEKDVQDFYKNCSSIHDGFEFLIQNNTYIMDKGLR